MKEHVLIEAGRADEQRPWRFFVEAIDDDGRSTVMWDGYRYDDAILAAHDLEIEGMGPVIDRVGAP